MEKKKTRLKNLNMTSVDLVRRGANQRADIMLYKSADGGQEEIPQGLWKSIQDAVSAWWNGQGDSQEEFNINKSAYLDALEYSLDSIRADESMDDVAKRDMAIESIGQFTEALTEDFLKSLGVEYEPQNGAVSGEEGQDNQTLDGVEKSQSEATDEGLGKAETTEEGEREMKIDKSVFTAEELEQYQALIAKAKVDEEEEEFVPEEEEPAEEKKEDEELHPAVKKALEQMESMTKSMEMKELAEIAKKYAPLGEKEDELAETLYEMKKSSPKSYDSYVSLLDNMLGMVEKSGMFEEIGKSGHSTVSSGAGVEAKIESIASEIQKADPTLNRYEAIGKAWDQNPELLAQYEKEYQGGNK